MDVFSILTFIDYLSSYNNDDIKIIIGASNYDDAENGIFDKTRFDDVFDIAVSNTYKIQKTNSLKLLDMDFNNFLLLRYTNIKHIDSNIYLPLEKIKLIVVDWSVIKFINIKFLLTLAIFYLSKNGKLFFESSLFSEKHKLNKSSSSYSHEDLYFIDNNGDLNIKHIGLHFIKTGVFHDNGKILCYDKIITNNFTYLNNFFNPFGCFDISFHDDDNYPNNPLHFNKHVYKYFVITKTNNLCLSISIFRALNRFLYFG